MTNTLRQYFRCEDGFVSEFDLLGPLSVNQGYFGFGKGNACYGRNSEGIYHPKSGRNLPDLEEYCRIENGRVLLPFDPDEVVTNFTYERYLKRNLGHNASLKSRILYQTYYAIRPFMPVAVRKHFQKAYLANRTKSFFPAWPVDITVDSLMKHLLSIALKASGRSKVPFIWFWPNGKSACSIMTHDVEAPEGRDFCSQLMDIDDEFDIPASFQIVPEERYEVSSEFIQQFKSRGFEIDVQDLNHDGRLFWNYEQFKQRAERINEYGRQFNAAGFRSAILYRNQDWFDLLQFEYDMSVPNVGRFDPQRGGCCTVMPYFIGDLVELPVTTIQDYSLFHILNDYSINIWRRQIEIILRQNGLISFIVHPDYLLDDQAQSVYKDLLAELNRLRSDKDVWIALPAELNRWWRNRSAMKLRQENGEWVIEGPDSERACIAYAVLNGDDVIYTVPEQVGQCAW